MLDLAEAEEELSVAEEIAGALTKLERDIAQTELARMLSGSDDEKNAILTIHAGAGGTESGLGRNAPAHVLALDRAQRVSDTDPRHSGGRGGGD